MISLSAVIADELGVQHGQVAAAISLLDEGSTVPFISRYRKEATGGLDDSQLRTLEQRLGYLRELEDRRATIIKSIDEQGKLTGELSKAILQASTKTALEDLYLPYKPKRRTKAQIAREAGLEPLALALFENPDLDPDGEAAGYIDAEKGVDDVKAALDGARNILMENFSEDAALLSQLRERIQSQGVVQSRVFDGKETEGAKYRDYFDYSEALKKVPSHRALALFRGRNEGILRMSLDLDLPDDFVGVHPCEGLIASHYNIVDRARPADKWLADTVRWTWRVKLLMHIELDLMNDLREMAEAGAIEVFSTNMKDLLLAAPAGPKSCIGLDPGLRTGVKVAVIDKTGKYLDQGTIYPHAPKNQWDQSIAAIAALAKKHQIELVAIGNGTASRETDKLVLDLIKRHPELRLRSVMVSEAGASVYSASEFASKEFPDLDVTIRGAVSIARRLQDPLAELVKIDPKAIGVGQYQHDVNQYKLARSLDASVEDCVNDVGVDVNTASAPLLERVSGLNQTTASNIVEFRNSQGAFQDRKELLKVPRMGDKSYEQAAGFLKVMNGANPLDASSVHPEAYSIVEKISAESGRELRTIIGDSHFLRGLNPAKYVDDRFGLPTVMDILKELEKPGRDPRPEFKTAVFREGVETLKDLEPNMVLEGTVTNVTNFGAFVDIGVHQDGLVHISALADKFVDDPRKVVRTGDVVRVKVMEVDVARKRVGLTMRMGDDAIENQKQKSDQTNQRSNRESGARKDTGGRGNADKNRKANPNQNSHRAPDNKNSVMANKLREAMAKKAKS